MSKNFWSQQCWRIDLGNCIIHFLREAMWREFDCRKFSRHFARVEDLIRCPTMGKRASQGEAPAKKAKPANPPPSATLHPDTWINFYNSYKLVAASVNLGLPLCVPLICEVTLCPTV